MKQRLPRLVHLLVAGVALVAACGGDDPTGSSNANINGTWRISYTNLSGSGVTCNSSPIDYQITQSGSTFTGTSGSTWQFTCMDGVNPPQTATATGAVISNGTVNGTSIQFNLASTAAVNTGTVSGNSMSGTSHWTIDLGGGSTLVLNGTFAGVRL